jgi:hypothetical protein
MLALASPVLLFGLASLTVLGYFFTAQPFLGTISVILGLAAGVLALLVVFLVPNR